MGLYGSWGILLLSALGVLLLPKPPESFWELYSPKPGMLVFRRVPELLKFKLAPLTPIEVLMPLLLKFKCTPGMIFTLFRNDQAIRQDKK